MGKPKFKKGDIAFLRGEEEVQIISVTSYGGGDINYSARGIISGETGEYAGTFLEPTRSSQGKKKFKYDIGDIITEKDDPGLGETLGKITGLKIANGYNFYLLEGGLTIAENLVKVYKESGPTDDNGGVDWFTYTTSSDEWAAEAAQRPDIPEHCQRSLMERFEEIPAINSMCLLAANVNVQDRFTVIRLTRWAEKEKKIDIAMRAAREISRIPGYQGYRGHKA